MTETYPASFAVKVEGAGHRLDQYLVSQLQNISRARIQQLIQQEKVLVNDKPAKASFRLRGNEELKEYKYCASVYWSPAQLFARTKFVFKSNSLEKSRFDTFASRSKFPRCEMNFFRRIAFSAKSCRSQQTGGG